METILNFPECVKSFWITAVTWSGLMGWAAFYYGVYIHDKGYHILHEEKGKQRKRELYIHRHRRLFAYGVTHSVLYFVCTISGFAAWYLLHYLVSNKLCDWENISVGTATLLITLTFVSVVGIAGGLGRIVFLGSWPK